MFAPASLFFAKTERTNPNKSIIIRKKTRGKHMEWMDRLNESMKYMEEHLTDEIDYEQLARYEVWIPVTKKEN